MGLNDAVDGVAVVGGMGEEGDWVLSPKLREFAEAGRPVSLNRFVTPPFRIPLQLTGSASPIE
jgi:hypothetical protein